MKRITIEPQGFSAVYKICPTCSKLRKGEQPFLVNPDARQCLICYGIAWQRKHVPVKKRKRMPVKIS